MRIVRLVPLVFLLAACSGGAAPTPQIIYVTQPPATGTGLVEPPIATPAAPTGTPRITPAPETSRPQPSGVPATATSAAGSVGLGAQQLIVWKDRFSDYVSYLVVAEIKNEGSGWAEIDAFDSDYAIYDPQGAVITTSSFLYAYPDFLAPGETGYLVWDSVQEGYAVDDFATVEVNGRYTDAAGPPANLLTVSNTTLRAASFGDGLEVTGQVENIGSEAIESAHAAAIYFDASGEIIGASTTNLIDNVAPGQKKAFETIGTNPLKRSDVADFTVIASGD